MDYADQVKGIVLAGGTGSRLWPLSIVTNKQLLPIYDKPLIYYPIATLMLAGIREILIITSRDQQKNFQKLLGDGSDFGICFKYEIQNAPNGLPEAFILGEEFLAGESSALILGDNIFHGLGLGMQLSTLRQIHGAHIFTYEVDDASQYGVLTVDSESNRINIEEKPVNPRSNNAITGLYFFDNNASEYAKSLKPSARGELEITDLINIYLRLEQLEVTKLSRGVAWLDTGTPKSLHDAGSYVKIIEDRIGLKIACLEEIAYLQGYINNAKLLELIQKYGKSEYAKYLSRIYKRSGDHV